LNHIPAFFAKLAGDLSKAPARIALRDNLTSLQNANVDRVIVEHFNAHASLSPQDFIEKVLKVCT
jgi:riboflavin kinase/FMN adenylyltransferase